MCETNTEALETLLTEYVEQNAPYYKRSEFRNDLLNAFNEIANRTSFDSYETKGYDLDDLDEEEETELEEPRDSEMYVPF